jgi:peptidoglycan/LPS O-acetylase OafA/YrhL
MKVLSMLFIIMGHGLHEPLTLLGYSNAECIEKSPACLDAAFTQPGQYLMFAGQQGVDTFFFIGGFLLSFIGKSRAVPVLLGTLMRLARLLPLFGFAMMMYILIAPYIASGPFSPRFQAEVFSACGDGTWWSELLFINSVYPWIPNQGGCMGWSWYLSNDMIFAVIGMMLVGVWKRSAHVAWIIATILFVACGVVSMQQALHYKMQYNFADASYIDYTQQLYFRPWHRLPSFLVGLMAPWGLHLLEQIGIDRGSQPTSLRAKLIVHISCLLALAVLAVCIFLPWTNAAASGAEATARKPDQWSLWSNAFWIGWSRPAWCVAWLVLALACYFDYLPLVNAVFAARIFGPLSNLTFGAYLFHPIIIKIIAASQDGYFTYSALDGIERAMLYSILAYSVAIVSWCLVEKPFATLTVWLAPKKVSNKPAKKVAQAPGQKSCTRTKGDSDLNSSTPFNEKATEQP